MIQNQCLNYIIKNKDISFITTNNLNADYFSDYRSEFNFILSHYEKYNQICDLETFLSNFPNFDVVNVNESPSYLIATLIDDYNTRKIAQTFTTIKTLLMSNKTDKAIEEYKKLNDNLSKTVSIECVDLLHDTSRYDDYLERTQDFNKYYIKTGFRELDDVIGGWDRQEELATIIARSNVGKSMIAIRMALAAVQQGLNVGFYSGEMSERKVGYRLDTFISHISNGSLTHGNISIQAEYKKYIDTLPSMFKGSLKVLTPNMINGPAGVSSLRAFIEKENLDILFVDQHSLLEDDRGAKNPVERASNISRDLKNLQVMKKIPIISVSQMNRTKNEDDSDLIDLTQIAQADRIGQDSTVVIGISRDKKDTNLMKLQLVKSRDSENGKVFSYHVDFNTGTFQFLPENGSVTEEDREEYSTRYQRAQGQGADVF